MGIKIETLSKFKFYQFSKKEAENIITLLQSLNFSEVQGQLSFLKIDSDTNATRLLIRKIVNTGNTYLFIFSKSSEVARLSWTVQAFSFIDISKINYEIQFKDAVLKLINASKNRYDDNLIFKSHNSFDIVIPETIIFILANGNYSTIYLEDKKEILVTKQLGQIEKMISPYSYLGRFGRSTIINLNKIKKIKDKTIFFKGDLQLKFPGYSKGFIYLKNKLIWKDDE